MTITHPGTLQSFCEVSLGSQAQRTSIATSPHPKWDSTMQFLVKSLSEDVMCITVYEKGYFKPNGGSSVVIIQKIYGMFILQSIMLWKYTYLIDTI